MNVVLFLSMSPFSVCQNAELVSKVQNIWNSSKQPRHSSVGTIGYPFLTFTTFSILWLIEKGRKPSIFGEMEFIDYCLVFAASIPSTSSIFDLEFLEFS